MLTNKKKCIESCDKKCVSIFFQHVLCQLVIVIFFLGLHWNKGNVYCNTCRQLQNGYQFIQRVFTTCCSTLKQSTTIHW